MKILVQISYIYENTDDKAHKTKIHSSNFRASKYHKLEINSEFRITLLSVSFIYSLHKISRPYTESLKTF